MHKILLLTKNDTWSTYAGHIARFFFGETLIWEKGVNGDPHPESFKEPKFAAILSFLSPWIVPPSLLDKSLLSLNFHPGSCDYPGIGCYNFALYERAQYFGPVCHHMLPKVDSGKVVREILFDVLPNDTVETLKLRTMVEMLAMFHDVIAVVASGEALPNSLRQWQRRPFTRQQLNELCEITPTMSEDEKQRRILATTYPGYPGPYIMVNGQKQYFPVPNRQPLA